MPAMCGGVGPGKESTNVTKDRPWGQCSTPVCCVQYRAALTFAPLEQRALASICTGVKAAFWDGHRRQAQAAGLCRDDTGLL